MKRKLTWLAGARIEARLRVDEVLARHHHPLLHRNRAALLLGKNVEFARGIAGIGDQTELQLGGGAQQILHLRGVLKARHFDQDPVIPLLLDVGLLGAGAVEAAVQHFDRLGHGVADLFGGGGFRQQQLHRAVASVGNVEPMPGRAGQRAADVLIERPQ